MSAHRNASHEPNIASTSSSWSVEDRRAIAAAVEQVASDHASLVRQQESLAGSDSRKPCISSMLTFLGVGVNTNDNGVHTDNSKPAHTLSNDDIKPDIAHDLLLVALGLLPSSTTKQGPTYSAFDRHLLIQTLTYIDIEPIHLYNAEKAVGQQLYFALENATRSSDDASDKMKQTSDAALAASAAKTANWKKVAKGGLAMGLTGGLAAPAIAPLLIGASGGALAFLGGSSGVVVLGGLFGVAGGGLAAKRVERRVQGIEHFEFEKLVSDPELPQIPSLHATIVCSGVLLEEDDYIAPFQPFFDTLSDRREVFTLKHDTAEFIALGKHLEAYTYRLIRNKAVIEVLKRTSIAAILSAVALPKAVWSWSTSLLDSNWSRCMLKAKKAGELLADVLLDKIQGERPVNLIGTSFGAVTVLYTLLHLAKKTQGRRNLVYSAVLIALPLAPPEAQWKEVRSVVAGPLVNCWSDSDWVLAVLARASVLQGLSVRTPSGICAVEQPGVTNVDVSEFVHGHLSVVEPKVVQSILEHVKSYFL